jgi:hypothetical protein
LIWRRSRGHVQRSTAARPETPAKHHRDTCAVELVEVEGRRLKFKVTCSSDDKGPIGAGFHERFIIDLERFLARLGGTK